MKYNVGSKVRFLNDVGGGVITRVKNEMVWVKTEDGFEMPSNKSELVVIEEATEAKSETKVLEFKVEPKFEKKNEESSFPDFNDSYIENKQKVFTISEIEHEFKNTYPSLFVAFVLKDEKNWNVSDFDLYLINDSNYEVFYNIITKYKTEYAQLENNIIEYDTKSFITTIKRSDLNDISEFIIQAIAYKKGIYTPQIPFENRIKIRPTKFFKQNSFLENDFFDEKAIVYQVGAGMEIKLDVDEIDREELKKIIEKKEFFQTQTKKESLLIEKKKEVSAIEEVDLHIEKIIPNYLGMSNAEMLITQISHFRTKLESAIFRNIKKIVFIHGIGNGTLKHELRKVLDEYYHDLKYQDASFKEYGYGATLIFINK
ncbi:MAG: hypothetical protein A2033_05070 [Bacteroidetes bacterium GWA2_31_9]|nr:MAG: hypothetical protein A2033_05070 [Bacteroidetes bacterium GWA2_31_9]